MIRPHLLSLSCIQQFWYVSSAPFVSRSHFRPWQRIPLLFFQCRRLLRVIDSHVLSLPSNHIISNFRYVSHGLARSWFVCLVGRALPLRRITHQVMGFPSQCPRISFFLYLRFLLKALIYNPNSSSTSVLLSRKYYTRDSQDRHASYLSSVRDGTRRSKCMSARYWTIGNLNICAHLRHPQRREYSFISAHYGEDLQWKI